ncbi:hypothetical protein Q3G72_016743 [Acer saccharum]|nr:hypothetical protein Q3G72_016743 [Acer saccharum]
MAAADASFDVRDHGTAQSEKNRVQCNYCCKVMSGFSRLKYHLGGIRGDVTPCEKVPENVREVFRNILLETKRGGLIKEVGELHHPDHPQKRNVCSDSNGVKRFKVEASQNVNCESGGHEYTGSELEGATQHVSLPSRRIGSPTGSEAEKKKVSLSWQAQKCMGRFFYEMGIDFSVANSPSFRGMINAMLSHSQGEYEIPSCDELKGLILQEEVKEMRERVERIRHSWETTGCSILLDGWIDQNGRNLVSFIVDCPQGPIYLRSSDVTAAIGNVNALQLLLDGVIEEVGVGNVVQIIASLTTGWMGHVGKQFMERQRTVFWTVSASHCIELVLEKISMLDFVRGILDKAKTITRFIHGHAAVLKLFRDYSGGGELIKRCKVSSAVPYMTLENIVLEKENLKAMFASSAWNASNWSSRTEGNRVVNLVKDRSFWTEAMRVVKAAIPLVNVVRLINRADKPQVGDVCCDKEVSSGMFYCIRMVQDQLTQALIALQLDKYINAKGDFNKGSNMDERNKYHPVEWWSHYGNQCPELQKFAIRILSQNCEGASKYGLKRSLCEKLLRNGRNDVEQQESSDLTFVHYNLQLQRIVSKEREQRNKKISISLFFHLNSYQDDNRN